MLRSSFLVIGLFYLGLPLPSYADVAALGRIEPQGGVVRVSAPVILESGNGVLLRDLKVKTGDQVTKGQVLAVTESAELLESQLGQAIAALDQADDQRRAAEAVADADCVRAEVSRRESDRRKRLADQDLSSQEEAERASADASFQEAVCAASKVQAEASKSAVKVAVNQVTVRETLVRRTRVRAPFAGTVLQINTWPGEAIGRQGILELGKTSQMYAIAEVYETDIAEVKVGQPAAVSSKALSADLRGVVEKIRPLVRKQDVMGTDPAARKDARVIEVEIRLEDSSAVSQLTNLQVEVLIEG